TLAGVVGIAAAGFAGLGGGGSKAEPTPVRARTEASPRAAQLPGGGRRIFPDRRVVAFYGNPQDPQLGALGIGTPAQAVAKLRRQARGYARGTRPVLPALELVSTVAAASPGAGADYAIRAPAKVVDRYLRAARRAGALLLLDVQPGLNDFPGELRRLRRWLREPDVGLALDPEWRVQPGQVPGKVIGSVGAGEVNRTSAELARIVADGKLPEKLFVIHQFTEDMVRDAQTVVRRPGLATVFNVDGFGDRANKVSKYRALTGSKRGFHHGFKLFYSEDTGLMAPRSVMALQPRPDLIVYE
ncbi:MAG: hypothetical protein QOG11_1159, partial [Solirubrobacteraceae bacterium]|nr:hypothetical protein [Solirubrobacteraceae bacterium]